MPPTTPAPAEAEEHTAEALGHDAPADVDTSASQRRWILIATCLALLAVMVSVSGLNVAQQALAADLGASQTQLLWIINGYTVALAATLLPLGALGDRLGRKSVLVVGLGAFAAINLAAAFASDPTQLLVLRVAMGVSAALIMPATLSTITSAFPPEERGRAVGVWTGVAGGGGVIGLISSALLIDYVSWNWVFVAPIAIAAVALAITLPAVPNTREHTSHRFDYLGSFLAVVAVGSIVLAIHEGPEQGWFAPLTVAAFAAGLVALAGFVLWERRRTEPLLDVAVFRNRKLSAGAFSLTIMFALIIGMFLVLVQFLQAVLGSTALQSSLALLPMIGTLMVAAPRAPKISERFGYRTTMTVSLAVVGGALVWLATIPADPTYWNVVPALVVLGGALGTAMTPSTTAITESLPGDKQGVASALNDTVRELGGAIGVALVGSVLAPGYRSGISDTAETLPPEVGHVVEEGIGGAYVVAEEMGPEGQGILEAAQSAFLDGWSSAMWLAAIVAIGAAGIAAVLIPGRSSTREVTDDDREPGDPAIAAASLVD